MKCRTRELNPAMQSRERERERESEREISYLPMYLGAGGGGRPPDNGALSELSPQMGEDETDACVLRSQMYDMLQRHVMGITAAQFVREPKGEATTPNEGGTATTTGPSTSSQ